jgi:predicted phage terminase large subunit-like protein
MLDFYVSKIPGAELHLQRRMASVGKGWVQFKTAEEPDSLRGESIDFAVTDEAAHVGALRQIWELCLRPCLLDRQGAAWFISTPAGFNYFNDLHKKSRDDVQWASFQHPSRDNPYLNTEELESLVQDLPSLVRRQEIDAEFVQLSGSIFKREDIRVLDAEPAVSRWVRSWDIAATEKTSSDYTVGSKVGMTTDGTVVVANVVRGRWEWPTALRMIGDTARADGPSVRQGVEVVGTQVGILQTLLRDPTLANLSFQPIQVVKDKTTRALPLAARCEQGKLAVVRAAWTQALLDEFCAFPETDHDDIVDSVTGATKMFAGGALYIS